MNSFATWSCIALAVLQLAACDKPNDPKQCAGVAAPTANAGADAMVGRRTAAVLDGSGSTATRDGASLTYVWLLTRVPIGSSAALVNPSSVNPSLTPDLYGQYTASLVVHDGCSWSTADTVTITATNTAPVARVSADQTVPSWTRLTLSGANSSDPNGDALTMGWTIQSAPAGSIATLSSSSGVMPTFTPDLAGTYVIALVVSDGQLSSAPATVTVTATDDTPPNCSGVPAPMAHAGADATVSKKTPASLNGGGSTSNRAGATLAYQWSLTQAPAGSAARLVNPTTVNPSFSPDVSGSYTVSLVVHNGCARSAADTVTITATNTAPVARVSADQTVPRRTQISLSGANSADANGDPVTMSWTLQSAPPGSTAALANASGVAPSFTPDLSGNYVVSLVVNDGEVNSAPAIVTVTATNSAPVANPGASRQTDVATTVTITGSGTDTNGDPLTYRWTLTAAPSGSTAQLTNPDQATVSITPDVPGNYTLSLVASDGELHSTPSAMTVTANPRINPLSFQPVDAEYSKSKDRIIFVAASPNALYIYDPLTNTQEAVPLPTMPTSVSVSPSGNRAAVGHNGYVSIVDLSAKAVTATHPVTCDVLDVVLGDGDYVYAFPRVDQWESIRTIKISTGTETTSDQSIYAGTRARLHPDGRKLYGADNGLSPSDIERYTIGANGTATYAYDSPYHGTYEMCGDLWFEETGARIYTRCGNVFHSTDNRTTDMTYIGALGGLNGTIRYLSHSSAAGKVVVVKTNSDELRIYDTGYLNYDGSITLPKWVVGTTPHTPTGQFVFFNAAGTRKHVVLRVAGSDHGVVTYH
jgi:hypothetical protein